MFFLLKGEFDHTPLLLCVYPNNNLEKPFRFHNMWCHHPKFLAIVSKECNTHIQGCRMFRVFHKMKMVKIELREMNKRGFGDVEASLVKAKNDLAVAHNALMLILLILSSLRKRK